MPEPLVVTVPHRLGKAQAKDRIIASQGKLETQLAAIGATAETSWHGDQLNFTVRAFAQAISGRIVVLDENVRVEVDLPVLFALLGRTLAGKIERQGRLLLTKE